MNFATTTPCRKEADASPGPAKESGDPELAVLGPPQAPDELGRIGEFRVVVEQVVRRRVRRVYFERLEPAPGEPVPEGVE